MAAFSYQHYPSLLDTIFLPNTPTKNMSGFSEEGDTNTSCFPQFHPLSEAPLDIMFHQGGLHVNQSSKVASSDNETSVTKKQSTDSSTVVDKLESGEQVTQKLTPADRKRKIKDGSSLNSAQSKLEARVVKNKRQRKSNMAKMDEEKKPKSDKKASEEPPTGYIHVRARRGQATDSHSLAERVRREKISERMKILQRLVPGCDKVTGKALMLDEIINYVQSLQNQVEFLSMKLASFNPLFYDFGPDLDAFMVRPERLSGLSSPLPSLQQCSTFQPTAFADASATSTTATATNTTFATDQNTYPPIDNPALLLLQGQRLNEFNQDSESLLWEVEAQRQKFHNLSGFNTNLCSFH